MTPSMPVLAGRRPRPIRPAALIEAWMARDAYRRQMRRLAQLDDHMLRDIGLTGDDVRRLGI